MGLPQNLANARNEDALCALAQMGGSGARGGVVLLGRDTRDHSAALSALAAKGASLAGATVVDLGLCTTPQVVLSRAPSAPPLRAPPLPSIAPTTVSFLKEYAPSCKNQSHGVQHNASSPCLLSTELSRQPLVPSRHVLHARALKVHHVVRMRNLAEGHTVSAGVGPGAAAALASEAGYFKMLAEAYAGLLATAEHKDAPGAQPEGAPPEGSPQGAGGRVLAVDCACGVGALKLPPLAQAIALAQLAASPQPSLVFEASSGGVG